MVGVYLRIERPACGVTEARSDHIPVIVTSDNALFAWVAANFSSSGRQRPLPGHARQQAASPPSPHHRHGLGRGALKVVEANARIGVPAVSFSPVSG